MWTVDCEWKPRKGDDKGHKIYYTVNNSNAFPDAYHKIERGIDGHDKAKSNSQ